jgi:UDP-2,4-diacetamido-2,4,6-trideoxy-beta-L-altropyranose hydrolase
VSRLDAMRSGDVALRLARPDDCARVWEWRNDPETRQASFDTARIPLGTHAAWFRESLVRIDRKLYVILAEGRECGSARLDFAGDEALVSIHLAPEYRGRGVGPAALERLAETAFRELELGRLVARVKADNAASLAAFARAGFTRVADGAVITLARARRERA